MLKSKISAEFDKLKNNEKKIAQEKYLKNKIQFMGLSNPQVKQIFSNIRTNQEYKMLDFNEKYNLALYYLQNKRIEEKIISMHILNNIHKMLDKDNINEIREIVKKGCVQEWASCDGLCSNVFKPWSSISKENTIHLANFMYEKDNIWIRRMSCVSIILSILFEKA